MTRKEKIALLNDLNTGKITLEKFKQRAKEPVNPKICLWIESQPGLFKSENDDRVLSEPEINKVSKKDQNLYITIKKFNSDGTPFPPLARSEKEIDLN